MKSRVLLFIFVIIFSTSACTKKSISPTQVELTTIELQNVIRLNKIQRVIPITIPLGNLIPPNTDVGENYTFSNGFFNITGAAIVYNLNNLRYYQIQEVIMNNTSYHTLELYFSE